MGLTITFAVIAMLAAALAMHPFLTYPLSLWLLKRLRGGVRSKPAAAAAPLTFAICMCAYNEERVIESKIRNLLVLRDREPGLQIHVYVDAASDRTAQILGRYADRIDLHVSSDRHGKTYGMNLLSARAQADVLVFTDANVLLDLACIDDLRTHFQDPSIGCVCGNLTYTNANTSVTAASGSLYWRFEEALKRLESDTGSMIGADGSIFAIRRELRRAPPDHIIDDMYVSLMSVIEGYRLIQTRDVRAYEESATQSGEEFSRKVRIACQAFNVHRLLWPRLRCLDALTCYKYVSHKFLRWLSIYFAGIAVFATIAACIAAGQGLLAGVLVAAGVSVIVLGVASIKPFSQILDVLTALAGAGLGVLRSIRGERFQTWTPAASPRARAEQ